MSFQSRGVHVIDTLDDTECLEERTTSKLHGASLSKTRWTNLYLRTIGAYPRRPWHPSQYFQLYQTQAQRCVEAVFVVAGQTAAIQFPKRCGSPVCLPDLALRGHVPHWVSKGIMLCLLIKWSRSPSPRGLLTSVALLEFPFHVWPNIGHVNNSPRR